MSLLLHALVSPFIQPAFALLILTMLCSIPMTPPSINPSIKSPLPVEPCLVQTLESTEVSRPILPSASQTHGQTFSALSQALTGDGSQNSSPCSVASSADPQSGQLNRVIPPGLACPCCAGCPLAFEVIPITSWLGSICSSSVAGTRYVILPPFSQPLYSFCSRNISSTG